MDARCLWKNYASCKDCPDYKNCPYDNAGIVDSRTGKVLITKKRLLKDVKKYFRGLTNKELQEKVKNYKKKGDKNE